MIKLIIMTDLTESFGHNLLHGILEYSRSTEPWVVKRMPPSYKHIHGFSGMLDFAVSWKADAIIGRFDNDDNVEEFGRHGIVAIAQDFKRRFSQIPNVTGDYCHTGRIAADYFMKKGFKNFAFYGYKDVCWSDERCQGFCDRLKEKRAAAEVAIYKSEHLEDMWYYGTPDLCDWLKKLPKPVALFTCDDTMGANLMEHCYLAGLKVPEDIAVLGVDNDEITCGFTNPPMSSVKTTISKGGFEAAALIEEMVRNRDFRGGNDILITPVAVVERLSTDFYPSTNPHIVKCLKYISMNITSQITVEDVVRQVPMSRRLLEIRFRQDTGQSIHQYIASQRMRIFAANLLESDEPIADVASKIGVVDYKNLARVFRQVKGCSPSEYRKKHKFKK